MKKTIYLEMQEIKANAEAILLSIAQLEDFINSQADGRSPKTRKGGKKRGVAPRGYSGT